MNTHNHHLKYSRQEELKQQIKRDKGWYFITFVSDLPHDRPYSFILYKEPYVLLKNNRGKFNCYLLPLHHKNDTDFAQVRSFTVVEKQGHIWFWHPRNSKADPKLIPTINE